MINMSKPESNLGEFLKQNSKKSNKELADSIRENKKLSNEHDNVVIYQEKRSICATAEKLLSAVKCYDDKATITIKTNNKKWQV